MELSAKTLRSVEFRTAKLGGYHHGDVDEFLERVAVGLETLQERLRTITERAHKAESRVLEQSEADEQLRTTLLLAQRTADRTTAEAREQAVRMVAASESQAEAVLRDAEDRVRHQQDSLSALLRDEAELLEQARDGLRVEVASLETYVEEQRNRLRQTLSLALRQLDEGIPPLPEAPPTAPVAIPPSAISLGVPPQAAPTPVTASAQDAAAFAAPPSPPGPRVSREEPPAGDRPPESDVDLSQASAVSGGRDPISALEPSALDTGHHRYLAELRLAGGDESLLAPLVADQSATADARGRELLNERGVGSRLRRRR